MIKITDKLICNNLVTLKPYESARRLFSGGQDWLNANESPFANEYQLDCETLNRYPDCQPDEVKMAYAKYAGVSTEQVLITRGADEGIELLIRTFCTPGQDKILICPPTHGMYAISAETCNIGIEKAPLQEDFSLDIAAMKQFIGNVNIVFVCSPNNPTGTRVEKSQLLEVLSMFKDSAIVVVDEAYIEFDWDNAWAGELDNYDNLVVLRTLSKAFALAGIRCGFTLAPKDIINALLKVIAPYPIPGPVAQIAEQALSPKGLERLSQQVSELQQQKAVLKQQLSALPGLELVGDDNANFILFRCAFKQALMDYLVENGMLIRDQSKQLNLENCLRVSVGNEAQNNRLLSLITQFMTTQEDAV